MPQRSPRRARSRAGASVVAVVFALGLASPALAGGIVDRIQKAPIVPDGNVAGAVTDFVIDLAFDMDPAVPGLSLAAGSQIHVTLPPGFVFVDPVSFPIADVRGPSDCRPGNLECSTAVLLRGWPQNPVNPGKYELSLAGNTLVFDIVADVDAVGADAPGAKQIHLIFNGWRNPTRPGAQHIRVRIEHADGSVQHGTGRLRILPRTRASINPTSVFAEGDDSPSVDDPASPPPNPNTIYQTTSPGSLTPWPWDFLLWDRQGEPFEDVTLVPTGARHGRLVQGRRTIGHVFVRGAGGRAGCGTVMGTVPSFTLPATPILGATPGIGPTPVARLRLLFLAGDQPGRCVTTLRLNGGNTLRQVVDIVD